MSRVLVTGGSGFIASHAILQLLAAGHDVRTTVRTLSREPDVRAMLRQGGGDPGDRLTFAAADLEADSGWAAAVDGCEYVLHVASPFPLNGPKHEDELIVPARDGALRVLSAARDGGVRRVVLTSSFAAIGYGHAPQDAPFDETNWTNLDSQVSAYVKSKTVAERAAWNFIATEGGRLELSVVNPVVVLGPVLGPDFSTSIHLVQRLMSGAIAGCPKMYFGVVDVRDAAELHIRAMTHPSAQGERFLAVAGDFVSMLDLAKVLRRRMGAAAKKVPTFELPNWVVRLGAFTDPSVRQILPELGKNKNATNEKARHMLNWTPRSVEDSIVATAESLLRLGLLKAAALLAVAMTLLSIPTVAQETKPVPKDSVRVAIPGCTKGQVFTAARRTEEEPGSADVPEGTHIRMNGPKTLIAEIKAHEGSMIQITGIMKRGQFKPGGVRIGGVGISAGSPSGVGGQSPSAVGTQAFIDVEGWRPASGSCPAR